MEAALTEAFEQGDGEQGMSAEVEEVVVDADPLEFENVGEDVGKDPFGGSPGGDEGIGRSLVVGSGQGLAVELAVGGEGQGGEADEGGRDHVVGQGQAEGGAQVGGIGWAGGSAGTRYATRRRSPGVSSRARTTASWMADRWVRAASISPTQPGARAA